MKRKSFILYQDYEEHFNLLSDEEKGILISLIFKYSRTREVKNELPPMVKMAFSFIKTNLDRDHEKYKAICKRNHDNGLKGGRPPKPKKPSGLSGNPKKPKKPDTDTDTDTDTEKDNDKKKINYQLIFDHFNSKKNLLHHKQFTTDIKNAIDKAKRDCSLTEAQMILLIDRHSFVVEVTKKNNKPIKPRNLKQFFGQKAYQASHLICSMYMEGGQYYEEYIKNKEKKTSKPIEIRYASNR